MTAASARFSMGILWVRATVPLPTGVACSATASASRRGIAWRQEDPITGRPQDLAVGRPHGALLGTRRDDTILVGHPFLLWGSLYVTGHRCCFRCDLSVVLHREKAAR